VTDTPNRAKTTPVLGIVGGLAGGKSTVAGMLAKRGAHVIDADRMGHRMLERPEVITALVQEFGDDILDSEGRVSRTKLGTLAFGDPRAVERLNCIVHPPIIQDIQEQLQRLEERGDVPLIVLDAPLLMETDLHRKMCDALLFVDTPEPLRRARAAANRQMDAAQFARRQRSQIPPDVKRENSDYQIRNSETLEELEEQVERLWPELCRLRDRDQG